MKKNDEGNEFVVTKMARNQVSANEIFLELASQKIGGVYQKAWSDFLAFVPP